MDQDMDLTNPDVSQKLTSLMHPHSHVILFYRYFLPTDCTSNDEPSSTDESISSQLDRATLQFFQKHSKHYLPLIRKHQHDLCESLGMKGRILISTEGINGTLSCREKELKQYQQQMESFDLLSEFDQPDNLTEVPKAGKGRLFVGIDWKISAVKSNQVEESQEPFPDLKIQIVKEIVNTGGTIDAADIPVYTGKEISPDEFHSILEQAKANQGCVDPDKKKEVVLIDVRNTFEHAIGHFVHPHSNQILSVEKDIQNTSSEATPAINPNTVTFSHFDSNFCSKYSDVLKDKKVLMYCTGGIRCVKASAMLKKRGVEDVSHLSGGIHRYLERYASEGFYKGKCMVFDQRVGLDPDSLRVENCESHLSETGESKEKSPDVVGKCIECQLPYDELSGANLCTVCRDLILMCQKCRESKNEYHCNRHQSWKNAYFTFLDGFTIDELEKQSTELQQIHDSYEPKEAKNVRRTLRKQIEKVRHRITELNDGSAQIETSKTRRCRTCFESVDICDGLCWGFWKHSQSKHRHDGKLEPIVTVNVGDRVQPGPNWNELRYGAKFKSLDSNHFKKTKTSKQNNEHESCAELKAGTVVEVKSWCSGEADECDCVAVVWDDSPSVDCSRRKRKRQQQSSSSEDKTALDQTNIYRWGTLARSGQRLYDVELLPV